MSHQNTEQVTNYYIKSKPIPTSKTEWHTPSRKTISRHKLSLSDADITQMLHKNLCGILEDNEDKDIDDEVSKELMPSNK